MRFQPVGPQQDKGHLNLPVPKHGGLIFLPEAPGLPATRLAVSIAGRGASSEARAFLAAGMMRTFVYVDKFNLYCGALRGTPWKWIGLPALFAKVLQPHHDILTVEYFTARVSGRPADQSSRNARMFISGLFNTTGPRSR